MTKTACNILNLKQNFKARGFIQFLVFTTFFVSTPPSVFAQSPPASASAGNAAPTGALAPRAINRVVETRVDLLKVPCTLSGPFDENVLKSIHAIGPASTHQPRTLKEAQGLLLLMQNGSAVPVGLDRYREGRAERLKAFISFFEGSDAAKQAKALPPLLQKVRMFQTASRAKSFQAELERMFTEKGASIFSKPDPVEMILGLFTESLETEASEAIDNEFHRGIGALAIKYQCSFDPTMDAGHDQQTDSAD